MTVLSRVIFYAGLQYYCLNQINVFINLIYNYCSSGLIVRISDEILKKFLFLTDVTANVYIFWNWNYKL